jgi:hypothetical protein
MHRAASRIPTVVLSEYDGAPLHLDAAGDRALGDARRALANLKEVLQRAGGRRSEFEGALFGGIDALRTLVRALSGLNSCRDRTGARANLPVHEYFGVRQDTLPTLQNVTHAVGVVFRAVVDLQYACLDINDLACEIEAFLALLNLWRTSPAPVRSSRGTEMMASTEAPYEPNGDGFERWLAAHHAYFLLNIYAASAVKRASHAITSRDPRRAALLLHESCVFVRGFSAAMKHSSAMSAGHYAEFVRPTMQPPQAPIPLTGSMQPEHAAYRASVKELLKVCAEPFAALTRRHRDLAMARDMLLEADLLDIEQHICVAAALVGNAHSIVQDEDAPLNALSALRQMRHSRALRYGPLMQFSEFQHDADCKFPTGTKNSAHASQSGEAKGEVGVR